MRRLLAIVITVAALTAACDPVEHAETPVDWTFEGFQVHSHLPADPVGLVYLFHGSGGSAAFAHKIEVIDQLNALVARGYGWVATESTERTGDKRWEVVDPSLTTNPDLARLTRLHAELIATTGVGADTPIFGIGMSNGARMVTLFGQTFGDAGYPVAAVAPFMGEAALAVKLAGGLTVPGFWVMADNDVVVDNDAIEADQAENAAAASVSSLMAKTEELLLHLRFTRIPAIDDTEAEAIHAALVATGAWEPGGTRLLSIDDTIDAVLGLSVPPEYGASTAEVRSQVAAILALHQFVGWYKVALADFFDAQLP